MYQASEQFNSVVLGNSRTFKVKMEVSGEAFYPTIKSITGVWASNSSDYISIGGTTAAYVDITMVQPDQTMENQEITLYIGVDIGDEEFEYVPVGLFTVQKPECSDGILSFVAYDRMATKFSGAYFSELSYPADGKDVLQEISDMTGVPIANLDSLPDGITINKRAYTSESGVDGDGNITTSTTYINPFNGYFYREALGYVAQFYGTFATINRYGEIELRWYTDTDYSIDASRYYDDLSTTEQTFSLGAIECTVEDTTLTSGEGTAGIQIENPVMTQSDLDRIYESLKELSFLPASLSIFGDPRLDLGDIVTVTDKNGNVIKLPIMDIVQTFDGGLKTALASYGKTDTESETDVIKGPTLQAIDRVYSELLLVKELVAAKANFDYVYSTVGEFKTLTTDEIDALSAQIDELDATVADIQSATIDEATIRKMIVSYGYLTEADIETLRSTVATIDEAYITEATVGDLIVSYGYLTEADIETLRSTVATINSAYIGSAEVDTLLANYATIEYLKTNYLALTDLEAEYAKLTDLDTINALIENLDATYATIEYLETNYFSAEEIRTSFLTADSAVITDLSAYVANINTLLAGNVGAGTLQTIHLTSDNVVIDDAIITSAMIKDIVADKITSGTIYTDLVKIANNTGENLLIDGSTIQINDGNVIRVQIGEDASGDYNLYLWNSGGTLIWDAKGLTEAGLTGNGAIIKDAAVADDAAISGYKLDIASVAECLNEDGSITVDAAQVTIDGSTLDYKLTTITDNTEAAQAEAKAAQEAADTAQATADAAQADATQAASDAASAQATATAAATAATAAQTTADTAKANAATAQSAADDAQATADAAAEAAANAQTYAEEVQRDAASALSEYAESVSTTLDGLQSQIDGQIETWYYDYAPTLTNLPASDWTTDDEKEPHVGDLFFDKSTGYSYRFFNNDGTYEWTLIQDTDITTALATASTAQDTADSKKRVFTTTPTPPYDVGDLWTDGTDIKTCMTARASGATYVSSDWVVLNDYANQDAVDAAQAAADAAQSAADSAQSAADTAASDAAAAQSTADTAKANAATAQTTASNAATAAANAQTAADEAQAAADEAQATADAIEARTTTLETSMTVVQGQITSKVWQTDIDTAVTDLEGEIKTLSDKYTTTAETVDGLVTQVGDIETTVSDNYESLSSQISTVEATANKVSSTVSDLQTTVTDNYSDLSSQISTIEQTASSISLSVSSVQSQIDNLDVGGRNYLLNTRTLEKKDLTTTASSVFVYSTDENGFGVWTVTGTGSYVSLNMVTPIDASDDALAGQEFVISADIKCDDIVESPSHYQFSFVIYGYNDGSSSFTRIYYKSFSFSATTFSYNTEDFVDDEWFRITAKFTGYAKSDMTQQTTTEYDNYVYAIQLFSNSNNSAGTISIRKPKLEIGTVATDWTPAPEDMATQESVDTAQETANTAYDTASSAVERVSSAELTIDGILNQISMLVTDSNGTSLMTQTSDGGWTFSMSQTQATLDSISSSLDGLQNSYGDTESTVSILQQAVDDLESTAEYIRITTYEDEPCIELGESDSDFKLLITNTRIMFQVGSDVPTYISNTGLITENITVNNNLQQGDYVWSVRSNGNYGLRYVG